MLDNQKLYEIESEVDKQIQDIKKARELETKAFVDGMKKGAELMFKAVREELKKEREQE